MCVFFPLVREVKQEVKSFFLFLERKKKERRKKEMKEKMKESERERRKENERKKMKEKKEETHRFLHWGVTHFSLFLFTIDYKACIHILVHIILAALIPFCKGMILLFFHKQGVSVENKYYTFLRFNFERERKKGKLVQESWI